METQTEAGELESNQRTIITHSVLIGLTPLIPIPIVDDLVKSYFQRTLLRRLARAHGVELNKEEVYKLTADRGGCLSGCVGTILIYPIKKIFRKLLFFLEIKRMVDLTSISFHQGYLLDYALQQKLIKSPNSKDVTEIKVALDAACKESSIKPVEKIIGSTYKQSKNLLLTGARTIERAFKNLTSRPDETQVEEIVREIEPEERKELAGVITLLQRGIEGISDEHFIKLKERFEIKLKEKTIN
jgi:uncharacterized protein (DUF697 family)